MFERIALSVSLLTVVIAWPAEAATARQDSIVLSGRLYPSGDLNAVVTAEMRAQGRPDVGASENLAQTLARIQMRSADVRTEPMEAQVKDARKARGGTERVRYRLSMRPWILPSEPIVERALPSVLLGRVIARWEEAGEGALELAGPLVVTELATIEIDPVYEVTPPAGLALERGFATYRCEYAVRDGALTVKRTLEVKSAKLPAELREGAAALAAEITDDLEAPVVIRRLDVGKRRTEIDPGGPIAYARAVFIPPAISFALLRTRLRGTTPAACRRWRRRARGGRRG